MMKIAPCIVATLLIAVTAGCLEPNDIRPPLRTPELLLDIVDDEYRFYVFGIANIRYDNITVTINASGVNTDHEGNFTYMLLGATNATTFDLNTSAALDDVYYRLDVRISPGEVPDTVVVSIKRDDGSYQTNTVKTRDFPYEEVFKVVPEEEDQ